MGPRQRISRGALAAAATLLALSACSNAEEDRVAEAAAQQRVEEAVGATESPSTSPYNTDQQAFLAAARASSAQAASLEDADLLTFGQDFCDQIDEAVAGGLPAKSAIEVKAYGVAGSGGDPESQAALTAVWGAASGTLCSQHSAAFREAMASLA